MSVKSFVSAAVAADRSGIAFKVAVMAALGMVGAGEAVVTNTWKWVDGVGTSVFEMADWNDAANWENGQAANGADVNANFKKNACTGVRYVKLPDDLTLHWYSGANGQSGYGNANRKMMVSDGLVTFTATTGSHIEYLDLYGDMVWGPGGYCTEVSIAGDIWLEAGKAIILNSELHHRVDLYAKEPGGIRRDHIPYRNISQSWGWFDFYAPQSSATDIVGQWTTKAGSPYLVRTGAKHTIPVGTRVTCATAGVLPEGAWVKRIFTDGTIEISENALQTVADASITFAAQTSDWYLHVNTWKHGGAGANGIYLNMFRPEDSMVLEIDTLENNPQNHADYWCILDTKANYHPGKVILRNVSGGNRQLRLKRCHVELSDIGTCGMPEQGVHMNATTDTAQLTVTNGVAAKILCITNLVGTILKDGNGTLEASLSRFPEKNTGTLEVKEGKFTVGTEENTAYVKNLIVRSGATIAVGEHGLDVVTATIEPGATVEGPGVIRMKSMSSIAGVAYRNGGGFFYDGQSALVTEANDIAAAASPLDGDLPTPALWVDVSQESTIDYASDTLAVSALYDARDTQHAAADYIKAVADGQSPHVVTNRLGRPFHIFFERVDYSVPGGTGMNNKQYLRWKKGGTNIELQTIRAVFKVECAVQGGGNILGNTTESRADFWRHEDDGPNYYKPLLFSSESYERPRYLRHNGRYYANGELRNMDSGRPYPGNEGGRGPSDYLPQLTVILNDGDRGCCADNFGYTGGGTSRSGNERFCEVIVYTNDVTEVQRVKLEQYLMDKWGIPCESTLTAARDPASIEAIDVAAGSAAFGVAAGKTVKVATVTGDGEFAKLGEGEVVLGEYAHASGTVTVKGGTLKIKSRPLDSKVVTDGAYMHLDAMKGDSFTFTNGRVSAWRDSRGGDHPTCAEVGGNAGATVTNNALNGHPMVHLSGTQGGLSLASLGFPACTNIRSVVKVSGSYKFGGMLVGCRYAGNLPDNYHTGATYNRAPADYTTYGLWRRAAGMYGYDSTHVTDALHNITDANWMAAKFGEGQTCARLNGVEVKANEAESFYTFDNGDLVTYVTHDNIYGDSLDFVIDFWYNNAWSTYRGRCNLGEYAIYPKSLSKERVRRIEAYLNHRWWGRETEGFRPAAIGTLNMAAGATLEVEGSAPLTVGTISGGGTISGAVQLAANPVFEVPVAADGSVATLTFAGSVDLSAGGTIRVTGEVGRIAVGSHPILVANGLNAAALSGWDMTVVGTCHRNVATAVRDGKLFLDVTPRGMVVNFR